LQGAFCLYLCIIAALLSHLRMIQVYDLASLAADVIPDEQWFAKIVAPSSVFPTRRKTQTLQRIGEALQRCWKGGGQARNSQTTVHRV
jgi:hypothetical protein